jgi:hypothetical protein
MGFYCIANLNLPRYFMIAAVFSLVIRNSKYYLVGTAIAAAVWIM